MILSKTPADFASAYADNLFEFEEVDMTYPCELIFYDAGGNIVALRRYAGQQSVTTSPRAILKRLISPEPLAEVAKCEFVRPEGRDATLSVEYDDGEQVTPEVLFTSSCYNHTANSPMGSSEQWRTIAAGECDEVAFAVTEGATLAARLLVDGIEHAQLGSFTSPAKGVVLFALVADDVLSSVAESRLQEGFDICFDLNGRECAQLHYRLRSAHNSDVRLAWLNAEGGISYHTFHRPTKSLHRSSREYATASGREVASVEVWSECHLVSEVLPATELQQLLAGVLSSPRLWLRSEDGSYSPQLLLTSQAPLQGDGAGRVSLTLRPSQADKRF